MLIYHLHLIIIKLWTVWITWILIISKCHICLIIKHLTDSHTFQSFFMSDLWKHVRKYIKRQYEIRKYDNNLLAIGFMLKCILINIRQGCVCYIFWSIVSFKNRYVNLPLKKNFPHYLEIYKIPCAPPSPTKVPALPMVSPSHLEFSAAHFFSRWLLQARRIDFNLLGVFF